MIGCLEWLFKSAFYSSKRSWFVKVYWPWITFEWLDHSFGLWQGIRFHYLPQIDYKVNYVTFLLEALFIYFHTSISYFGQNILYARSPKRFLLSYFFDTPVYCYIEFITLVYMLSERFQFHSESIIL